MRNSPLSASKAATVTIAVELGTTLVERRRLSVGGESVPPPSRANCSTVAASCAATAGSRKSEVADIAPVALTFQSAAHRKSRVRVRRERRLDAPKSLVLAQQTSCIRPFGLRIDVQVVVHIDRELLVKKMVPGMPTAPRKRYRCQAQVCIEHCEMPLLSQKCARLTAPTLLVPSLDPVFGIQHLSQPHHHILTW